MLLEQIFQKGEFIGENFPQVDEKDTAIIEALRADARMSEKKIAKKTGIPMTTVHNRLKRLVSSKTIGRFTVVPDYAKLGRPLCAFVRFKIINQAHHHGVFEHVCKIPGVYEVAMTTGEFDIMFKARVASMDELNDMVVRNLRESKGIGESRTMVCYRQFERT